MSPQLMKTVTGLAGKMQRTYHLPPGTDRDLIQAACVALCGVQGKSIGYQVTVAKNAVLAELRSYLPRGFRKGAIRDAVDRMPIGFHEFAIDPEPPPNRGSVTYSFVDEERMLKVLNDLPQRSRIIVEMRFGLNGAAAHRWEWIANKLGCHVQTAQSVFDEALEQLREGMENG
jgi:DNA-directed RNA polymerase specialized sigma24 family protein